jgi:uncharacterized membrane protein
MNKQLRSSAVLLILIVALSFVTTGSATAEGSITVLWDGYVYDINNQGQVVGREFPYNAVMWDNGELITLWELGEAQAINERGQVVGRRFLTDHWGIVLWDNGEMVTVTEAASYDEDVWAAGINNRGQVVGWTYDRRSRQSTAWLWEKGELITLWELGQARAINDRGQVVGTKSGAGHVLWDKGEITPLGFAAGIGPTAINNRGQVVGLYGHGSTYLWDNGEVITLPFTPFDINDRGQVVGQLHGSESYQAVLWDKGELTVLWEGPASPSQAGDINNRGQVAGTTSEGSTWKVVLWEK